MAREQIETRVVIADSDSLNYGRAEAHDKDIEVLEKLLKKGRDKMCDECIIGIWNEYESYDLVTYNDLKKKVREYNEKCDLFNRVWKTKEYKNKKMQDFLDKRKSTNLTHFNNCPYCGTEINWKELRKLKE